MLARALYRLTGSMPCRLIMRGGTIPYLERYYVGTAFGLTFYLHRFVDHDGDDAVHDHPFRAMGLCLCGWYEEDRMVKGGEHVETVSTRRHRRVGSITPLGLQTFHRIVQVRPETWTLFIHGRRLKKWVFLGKDEQGRPVYHQPYPSADPQWWLKSPRGRDAERQPFLSSSKGTPA